MSALRVGMRVKKVRNRRTCQPSEVLLHTPTGMTGTVTSIGPFQRGEISWDGFRFQSYNELTVTWDDSGRDAAILAYMVEPLTPPKSQELVSWESMPCNRDGSYRHTEAA